MTDASQEVITGLLAAAIEAAPFATLITDARVVVFANAAARKLLKCEDRLTLEGKLVSEIVHRDGLETSRMRAEILKRSSNALHNLPVKLVALDGSRVSLLVAGTPIELRDRLYFMFTAEE